MKKRILQFGKALRAALFVLLLSVAGLTNAWAQTFTVGNLNYTINDDGATVTLTGHVDGQDATGPLVIPESVELYGNTYPVTRIQEYAFYYHTGLTGDLYIPNSVTEIWSCAFYGCSGMTGKLNLSNSLTSIGYEAFAYSGFTGEVVIPESVTSIDSRAFANSSGFTTLRYNAEWVDSCVGGGWSNWFYGTSLSSVIIGENVRRIPCDFLNNENGFSVEQVVIPESVTHIGGSAFAYFQGTVNLPSSLTTIDGYAFYHCTGLSGNLVLPGMLNNMGYYAFAECTNLTGVVFPNSLTYINDYAFYNCTGLTGSLTIPNNVQWIGWYAFNGCTGLSGTLSLGVSLESIGDYAFFGFMDNITELHTHAMTPPNLGSSVFLGSSAEMPVYVPCGTTENYQNASGWNSFANIQESDPCSWVISATAHPGIGGTINGAGVYDEGSICTLTASGNGEWTFVRWTENGLTVSTEAEYTFTVEGNRNLVAVFSNPDYITFADENVGNRCIELWDTDGDGFLSYSEAAAVTSLGWAFEYSGSYTSFDELQYFTGLTSLHEYEFYYCYNLTSITLPENITTIGYWAFGECYSLASITLLSTTPPELSTDCPFCYINMGSIVVTVPCGMTSVYQNTNMWNEFSVWNEPDTCVYDIMVTLNHDEAGTVSGAGSYQRNTSCTLTATPAEGCAFLSWTENGEVVSTEAEYTFAVTGDRELVANFRLPMHAINLTASPEEGGTFTTVYDFEDGTLQGWTTLQGPNATSWHNWMHSSEYTYHDYSVGYGHDYSNGFVISESYISPNDPVIPDNYLVSPQVVIGDYISFWATYPNDQYPYEHFGVAVSTSGNTNVNDFETIAEWTLLSKGTKTGNTRTIYNNVWYEYTADLSAYTGQIGYVAIRHFNCYDQWLLCVDDIDLPTNDYFFEEGTTFTVTAIPNVGYGFESWEEAGTVISTDATLSFTVTEDRDLVANFVKVPLAINVEPNVEGRGTISGAGYYLIDEECTLTAVPYEGYAFLHWLENGEVVSYDAEYTFTVTGPRDLVAVFRAHENDIIDFADYTVKYICIANWDTDGDYELTYSEAASIYDLNYAFSWNTAITSFDELQYFTGLTYIYYEAFRECYNLRSIVLPENVTSIYGSAFYACTSLREITLPEAIEYVEDHAFRGCDELRTVNYNATNCSYMGSTTAPVFYDCPSLTQINIGENVESIPNYAFKRCSSVTAMNVAAVEPPVVGASTFATIQRTIPVSVPYGSGEAYRTAPYWEEFFNITEDYTPSQYDYHWAVDIHQYESNMTVIGVVQINGEEQATDKWEVGAFVGNECRGRQMLAYYPGVDRYLVFLMLYGEDGDQISFRLYDHESGEESLMACAYHVAFEPDAFIGTPEEPAAFNFGVMQESQFAAGWNWWSTYMEADDLLAQLEEGLGDAGVQIKSQSKFVINYGTTWLGGLNAINNEQTLKVQTNAACVVNMSGVTADPANHPITLNAGWNWIGYPCANNMSLAQAFSNYTPANGDQVKTQSSYAIYRNGIGWMGALQTLVSGKGLFYYSTTGGTLVFPNGSRETELADNITADNNHWVPDMNAYPSNMTVMAVVELEDIELQSERYELAAFANGEVRGSARLMYVEPMDRYMAFLTVTGDEAANLTFGLYDTETGAECLESDDLLVFTADAMVGELESPMVVSFRGTTGLSDLERSLQVYPNPVNRGERAVLTLPVDAKAQVEVVNALGVVVETLRATSVQAPASPGVYTLRITVDGKGTYSRKLIVR